ncbi:hypothetical protein WSM22_32900 [Cytophagales bacterium WSM2-2]|nr:hypothetical protein WSM22_32900 [Cytophagales bacterium WSM2-2]
MKSNLTKKEFKRRLTELTSPEKNFNILTSYNFSGTPFCGRFNDSTFELTRNSFWRHVKSITIQGQFKELDQNYTEVVYKVGIRPFEKKAMRIFTGLAFLGVNFILVFIQINLGLILTLNGLLILFVLFAIGINRVTTRLIDQRFRQEFKIENETAQLTT